SGEKSSRASEASALGRPKAALIGLALSPAGEHGSDEFGGHAGRRIHLQVVRPEGVNAVDLDVSSSLARAPVAAFSFAPVELVEIAMDADQVDVQAREENRQVTPPRRELDDVIHDQVVSGVGKCGQAAMESGEESRPHLMPPVE